MTARSSATLPVAALLLVVTACGGAAGQPTTVVERYDTARVAGDRDAAARELARDESKNETPAGPAPVSYEVVDLDVWSEHGAVCRVRERYADGRVEEVRLDLVREAGAWKIGAHGRRAD